MAVVLIALLVLPAAAGLAAFLLPPRAAAAVSVATGAASFALVLALIPAASHRDLRWLGLVRVDALSAVFLLATGFLYACVAVYSVGYLATAGRHGASPVYARRYWLGLNLFAWSMLAAPMMSNLALLWIAIEVTTIVSALLVALEGTDGAAEAAWKYVLLASAGLAIALLGTIFAYYAGSRALGPSYSLAFEPLLHAAGRLPHTAVQLTFVLAVLGFGTKMGLFPVHTWLPDAHSEAPTPVSALLSGSLLAVSFYAILRYYQVAVAALGPRFPRDVLLVFGVASLGVAALFLLDQRDYKRLLAYSSVEHMGILAIGVSFGVPIALFGVLLHVLAHAAAKGNAFMGAGVLLRKFGSKQIATVTGGLDLLPWSGPLFLTSVLALSAMPPFGIFRSEFDIVSGGLASSGNVVTVILVVLVTVAFLGLSAAANRMLLSGRVAVADAAPPAELAPIPAGAATSAAGTSAGGRPPDRTGPDSTGPDSTGPDSTGPDSTGARASEAGQLARGEPSAWMVVPVVAGVLALLILGLHPPAELTGLLQRAAALLGGRA